MNGGDACGDESFGGCGLGRSKGTDCAVCAGVGDPASALEREAASACDKADPCNPEEPWFRFLTFCGDEMDGSM